MKTNLNGVRVIVPIINSRLQLFLFSLARLIDSIFRVRNLELFGVIQVDTSMGSDR